MHMRGTRDLTRRGVWTGEIPTTRDWTKTTCLRCLACRGQPVKQPKIHKCEVKRPPGAVQILACGIFRPGTGMRRTTDRWMKVTCRACLRQKAKQ